MYKYPSADALGVLTEMQKNLATVHRPPLILLGLLPGPTGPGPDMLMFQIAISGNWVEVSRDDTMAADAVIVSTYSSGLQMLPEVSLPVSICLKRGSAAYFMHHIRSGLRNSSS